MFTYHWHLAIHHGAVTQSTSVGLGWYLVILVLLFVVGLWRTIS
jgi:hypothetical protein